MLDSYEKVIENSDFLKNLETDLIEQYGADGHIIITHLVNTFEAEDSMGANCNNLRIARIGDRKQMREFNVNRGGDVRDNNISENSLYSLKTKKRYLVGYTHQ